MNSNEHSNEQVNCARRSRVRGHGLHSLLHDAARVRYKGGIQPSVLECWSGIQRAVLASMLPRKNAQRRWLPSRRGREDDPVPGNEVASSRDRGDKHIGRRGCNKDNVLHSPYIHLEKFHAATSKHRKGNNAPRRNVYGISLKLRGRLDTKNGRWTHCALSDNTRTRVHLHPLHIF